MSGHNIESLTADVVPHANEESIQAGAELAFELYMALKQGQEYMPEGNAFVKHIQSQVGFVHLIDAYRAVRLMEQTYQADLRKAGYQFRSQ